MDEHLAADKRAKQLKKIGIFKLWKEILISRREAMEIREAKRALVECLTALKEISDPTQGLRYLENAERNIEKTKKLFEQMKERQKNLFKETDFTAEKEQVIAESQFEDMASYISGLRLLVTIAVEGKTHDGIIAKMGELISWFGLDSSTVKLSVTIENIGQKDRKLIIIKDDKCRMWDDMTANIRKRHQGVREVFERTGGGFFYHADPLSGTKITIMMP